MMKATRILLLLLVVAMVFAMFSGCKKNEESPTTTAPTKTDTPSSTIPASTDNPTSAPTDEPDSPYNYAAGKFAQDANGIATAKYEYELPLTTTDEVLTLWTTCYTPQYLADVGEGMEYPDSPFPMELQERTGVNIEYLMIAPQNRAENFSTLLAADQLPDLVAGATAFYPGIFADAIVEDEYFVNLYDYREYAPNYFYEIARSPDDVRLQSSVYMRPAVVGAFQCIRDDLYQQNSLFVRSDWLDRIGWTSDMIVTWEDTHELMKLFKSEIETSTWPLLIFNSIEVAGSHWVKYDTRATVSQYGLMRQVDENGKVFIVNTTERDKKLITDLNTYYNEGLIDPDWRAYPDFTGVADKYQADMYGYIALATSDCATENGTLDAPGAEWLPLKDPVLYEGQILHVGGAQSRTYYGSTSIAARCENIPLAMTWMDYRYSDSGADFCTWGVEGYAWEYNSKGEQQVSDFMFSDPAKNMTMMMLIFGANTLVEGSLDINWKHYSFPRGEKVIEAYEYLRDRSYDGAFEYPAAIKLDADQLAEVNKYQTDVMTYIAENFLGFLDDSVPLSTWDSYIEGLSGIGLDDIIAVYQEALDAYNAAN